MLQPLLFRTKPLKQRKPALERGRAFCYTVHMSRHLFKMLFGLVGMGLFGIICLVIINLYHKQATVEANVPAIPEGREAPCPRPAC